MEPVNNDAVAVVEQFLSANRSLDVDGMFAVIDDDAEWVFPAAPAGAPPSVRGKAANRAFFEQLMPMWKAFELTFTDVHALADDPNRVVAYYASSGKLIDDSVYTNTYLSLVRVANGRITQWIEFCDPQPLARGVAVLTGGSGGAR